MLFPDHELSFAEKTRLWRKHLNSLNHLDRVKYESAVKTLPGFTLLGTVGGIAVGLVLARRQRASALKIANAFKPAEQPIAVVFPNGRAEALPSLSETLQPSKSRFEKGLRISGAAAFGLFCGNLTGGVVALLRLQQNKESATRLASAINNFRLDVLREQANNLERKLNDSNSTAA
ncbi:MAG: hypothetical protein Q9168_005359 [Polycauliona sp. 1 TL-2023]